MKILTHEIFNRLVAEAENIKPRLKRELRFVTSVSRMADEDWLNAELVAVTSRDGNKGVLLLSPDESVYVLPYELSRGLASRLTGRAQPIICDFCRTWQAGSGAGSISFRKDKRSINSVSFLCCADLRCSWHVRSKTNASRTSRAQLREDMTDEQRAARLMRRLQQLVLDLGLEPASRE